MQGIVLQLSRAGFLLLLWVFIWSVLRILRTDIYAPTEAVMVRRGMALCGTLLPNHARLSQRGSEWYVEDLGSTNGTYLDRAKVTTAVRVPIGTPVRIGKTAIELRP